MDIYENSVLFNRWMMVIMSDTDIIDEDIWNRFVCFALGEDNGATGYRFPALLNYMNNDSISNSTKSVLTHLMISGIKEPELRSQMIRTMKEVAREIKIGGTAIYGPKFTGIPYQSWDGWKDNNMTDEWKALITDLKVAQAATEIELKKVRVKDDERSIVWDKLKAYEDKLEKLYYEDRTEYMKKQTDKETQENLDKWRENFDN